MDLKEKVELIQVAIKQLMEDRERNKRSSSSGQSFIADDDGDDDHLLTRLLNQLETLTADAKLQQPEPSADSEEVPSTAVSIMEADSETGNKVDNGSCVSGTEEIVRELKKVKRQNIITHCLLSAMIVLTVAWQLSEVSLILKLKDGMSHPFRSFGGVITGILKGPNGIGPDGVKQSSQKQKQKVLEASSSLSGLKIPELPQMELPVFDLNGDDV